MTVLAKLYNLNFVILHPQVILFYLLFHHLIYCSGPEVDQNTAEAQEASQIAPSSPLILQSSQTFHVISSSGSEVVEKYGLWSTELLRARGRTNQPASLIPLLSPLAVGPPPLGGPVWPTNFLVNPRPESAHPQCPWLQRLWWSCPQSQSQQTSVVCHSQSRFCCLLQLLCISWAAGTLVLASAAERRNTIQITKQQCELSSTYLSSLRRVLCLCRLFTLLASAALCAV